LDNILHIDIETFSSYPIQWGVHKYASSDDFKVQLFGYSCSDKATKTVDLENGEVLPKELIEMLEDPSIPKIAHNANFEIECLKRAGIKVSKPWYCTMIMSRAYGLPGGLEKINPILGLKAEKVKGGKQLVNFFSKPTSQGKIRKPKDYPEKWELYKIYSIGDVDAEKALWDYLVAKGVLPIVEWGLWNIDREINERGIQIDIPFVQMVCNLNEKQMENLFETSKKLTGLKNPNSLPKLKEWICGQIAEEQLLELWPDRKVSITADNIKGLINKTPENVREALKIRRATSNTSLAKYESMVDTNINGKLYDVLRFFGGRTRRWAGSKEQIQNFPRTNLDDNSIKLYKKFIREGYNPEEVIESGILKQLLRTAIIPSSDGVLSVADFSAIEARVLAWFAEEKWMEEIFASTGKIYEAQAAKMYNLPIDKIDKRLRDKGKVAVLSLGYKGGHKVIKLPEEEAIQIVKRYRATNTKIVSLWNKLDKSVKDVIRHRKSCHINNKVIISYFDNMLQIKLPSGGILYYYGAGIENDRPYYHGMIQRKGSRKWDRIVLHGGILTENIVQAMARDILVQSLINMELNNLRVIFHVHDEIVCDSHNCLDEMIEIMEMPVDWAPDLVMKATGYTSNFYKKE
jgi:DNA polymerase